MEIGAAAYLCEAVSSSSSFSCLRFPSKWLLSLFLLLLSFVLLRRILSSYAFDIFHVKLSQLLGFSYLIFPCFLRLCSAASRSWLYHSITSSHLIICLHVLLFTVSGEINSFFTAVTSFLQESVSI